MAKKSDSPIYSKLSYENAYAIKKNMLQMQADILNIVKTIEEYKIIRKREFMLKVKLKSHFKETKTALNKLIKSVPQTEGLKEIKKENLKKHKEIEKTHHITIESQLMDIKQRLHELA
ncbi:hypothetical protein CMI46_01740 [Candidatus Pacearchaeota archaeon]|nr:hypothetical protein [Candidatus Pacearchaeota archaeon]|tara:strand:- start:2777 stop:3130 length:354 start_codon:yes stop_codon:yes gene_type:complete